jgi:broad specificity phosphatase PhoE
VYLVRHGQAGTRDAYDCLSELGNRQARLLGEHFIAQGLRFAAAYTGGMSRQRQTSAEISATYADAGISFPAVRVDSGWDEFDLGRLYREFAPLLCAEDSEFCRGYEAMLEQVRASAGAHGDRIHRKWQPCDTKVVDAWISGRFPYTGETFDHFHDRIAACRLKMCDAQRHENIVVVTSAAPIAIWAGLSLEICDNRIMRLAGALHNASYTVVRLQESQLRLFTFNVAPHLAAPGLLTHR